MKPERTLYAVSACVIDLINNPQEISLDKNVTHVRVESDLDLPSQVKTYGATWLDRNLVRSEKPDLSASGFGADVQASLVEGADPLVAEGLAR